MMPSIRRRLDTLAERHQEVALLLAQPEATNDNARFRDLSREYAQLQPLADTLARFDATEKSLAAARAMLNDPDLRELAESEIAELQARHESLDRELNVLLLPKDDRDDANIFLEVRAGTGGDEAAIFAGDLFRMYSRYAERRGWRVEVLSSSAGEHGGFKEIIARIEGKGVFSRLKFESGTHRVQRVPATEAQGRIHTSAATVAILPEMDEVTDIELREADLRVDTFRASGAGGQHVNKTDSAIRITHLPTNIVVQCQTDRSQHRNRASAFAMLRARLYERELKLREEAAEAARGQKSEIGWGSQIRSYVLQPYQMVKDLRTGVEKGNAQGVLDGDLDDFMAASLSQRVAGTTAKVADLD